jgi:hypothetical protein
MPPFQKRPGYEYYIYNMTMHRDTDNRAINELGAEGWRPILSVYAFLLFEREVDHV